jgi:hypothetical protein
VILKRLATVAGLPSAKVLLQYLSRMLRHVQEIFNTV